MSDNQAWPEVPGLDDWYDNALKAGQGFKSDKEREDYIKSIGDPMMHPLFAENTEDLEGNPLAEALRALREEDKTNLEIATMYKEEGNDWLKKGDKKSLHEAYNRYTHALNILDHTATAALSGASSFNAATCQSGPPNSTSSECNVVPSLYPSDPSAESQQSRQQTPEEMQAVFEEEKMLKSLIFSNRAMVSLMLKNYGSCIRDADSSILCWEGNTKAHYRKCKSLVALRKFKEGQESSALGLKSDPTNSQILDLKVKCDEELEKSVRLESALLLKQHDIELRWKAAWSIMSTLGDPENGKKIRQVSVGHASASQNPAQLQEVLPHYLTNLENGAPEVAWPVLFLYPQYSQIDVIQGVTVTDMLALHLAEMFPEFADLGSVPSGDDNENGNALAVPWDRDREYQVSRLAIYAPLEIAPRISSMDEWLSSCREQSALRGEMGVEASEAAANAARKRTEAHELRLFKSVASSSSSKAKTDVTTSQEFDRVGYLDVHLGASFKDVVLAPGHVLAGGLLTFLVFVRDNQAHKKFLRDIDKRGHGVWPLHPTIPKTKSSGPRS